MCHEDMCNMWPMFYFACCFTCVRSGSLRMSTHVVILINVNVLSGIVGRILRHWATSPVLLSWWHGLRGCHVQANRTEIRPIWSGCSSDRGLRTQVCAKICFFHTILWNCAYQIHPVSSACVELGLPLTRRHGKRTHATHARTHARRHAYTRWHLYYIYVIINCRATQFSEIFGTHCKILHVQL